MYLDQNFHGVLFRIYATWQVTIGYGNGLAPNRRQVIALTNDEFYDAIYRQSPFY